jgi:Mg2+-importing ATPase
VRSPILLLALTLSVAAVVAVGTWLPYSPLSGVLGFTPLPAVFLLALAGMVVVYLFLVEVAKVWYYARLSRSVEPLVRVRAYPHRVARRAARFTARSPQSR